MGNEIIRAGFKSRLNSWLFWKDGEWNNFWMESSNPRICAASNKISHCYPQLNPLPSQIFKFASPIIPAMPMLHNRLCIPAGPGYKAGGETVVISRQECWWPQRPPVRQYRVGLRNDHLDRRPVCSAFPFATHRSCRMARLYLVISSVLLSFLEVRGLFRTAELLGRRLISPEY